MEDMKFAKKLTHLMRNMSQSDLAAQIGISQTTVSKYIVDGVTPAVDTALKMAAFFGVDPAWLFNDKATMSGPIGPGSTLTDEQIMLEIDRRQIDLERKLEDTIRALGEQVDWDKHAEAIIAWGTWEDADRIQKLVAESPEGIALEIVHAVYAFIDSTSGKMATYCARPKESGTVTTFLLGSVERIKLQRQFVDVLAALRPGFKDMRGVQDIDTFISRIAELLNQLSAKRKKK